MSYTIKDNTVVVVEGIERPYVTVDAWTSGNPGPGGARVTYGGKVVKEWQAEGEYSNNFFEFVAVYLGLKYLKEKGIKNAVIFTDSITALAWVDRMPSRTKTKYYDQVFDVRKKLLSLRNELPDIDILKWDTQTYGEIPADYGRK